MSESELPVTERPTQPPDSDPVRDVFERLEEKVDRLLHTVDSMFLLLQEARAAQHQHEDRIAALERVTIVPPPPVPHTDAE